MHRIGLPNDFTEGVVTPAAVQPGTALEQGIADLELGRPVHRFQGLEVMAGLQQRQTLHRVIGHVPGGGRIVMADQLTTLVAGAASGIAVEKTLDDPRRSTLQLFGNSQGAQLLVVGMLRRAATVPTLQQLIGLTG
ncbi:hypothetical protein D3C73_1366220 [compost metagenome]